MPTASTARSTTDAGVPGVAAINWPAPSHTTHGVSLVADHADNSAGSGAERVATAVSFLLISIAACSSWCSCRAMTSNTHFVMAMNGVSSGTVNNGTSLPLCGDSQRFGAVLIRQPVTQSQRDGRDSGPRTFGQIRLSSIISLMPANACLRWLGW